MLGRLNRSGKPFVPVCVKLHQKKRLKEGLRVAEIARSIGGSNLPRARPIFCAGGFRMLLCWAEFAKGVFYHAGDTASRRSSYGSRELLAEIGKVARFVSCALTILPHRRSSTSRRSSNWARGLADETTAPRRVVIEKPFGTDLRTARQLNDGRPRCLREQQVYRIDHYLGKETVQNMLVLRFANTIFEPIWNRNYIDHVQITVAEEVDVGRRGGYYDKAGVLRDMFQNHCCSC